MSGKKKAKTKKNEPVKKQEGAKKKPTLDEDEKKIQAHLDKVRENRSSRQRDYSGERFPFYAKIRIDIWRRVVQFAAREKLYKSHAIDKLLEAGLDALDA
jgi:hypothetical protein